MKSIKVIGIFVLSAFLISAIYIMVKPLISSHDWFIIFMQFNAVCVFMAAGKLVSDVLESK
jgi:hypothetical protein